RAKSSQLILESQQETDKQRQQAIQDLDAVRVQAEEIRRESKSSADGQRSLLEKELTQRRAEVESELNQLRLNEVERVDEHWEKQARKAFEQKQQWIEELTKSLEASLPSMIEGSVGRKLTDSQSADMMTALRRTLNHTLAHEEGSSDHGLMVRMFAIG